MNLHLLRNVEAKPLGLVFKRNPIITLAQL